MLQNKQKTIIGVLCLVTMGLLVVVVHCSVDFYWNLCERGALGLRFPVSRALSEALESSTENDDEAHRYRDQVDSLVEDVDEAVTIKLKRSQNKNLPETDPDIARARTILTCLREQQVLQQVSPIFTGLPSLLDTGTGDRVSSHLLYLHVLDSLGVDFHLIRLGRNVSVFVGEQELDLLLPEAKDDSCQSGHDKEFVAGASSDPGRHNGREASPLFLLAQYHIGLSSKALKEGKHDVTIRYCVRAATLAPDYSTPYLNMGIACGKLGNSKRAAYWFDKAVEVEPGRASTYIHYGNVLFKAGDVEKAGECWKKGQALASRAGESSSGDLANVATNNLSVLEREMEFIPMEKQVLSASFASGHKHVLDIRRIEREIRESTTLPVMNKYKLAQELFDWVWKHYDFQGYEGSNSILDVLDLKRGNCVTVTTLCALLFKRFGIDTNVIFFGNHVFLSFNYGGRRIDIESTCPEGFDVNWHKEKPNLIIKGMEILPALLYHNRANEYLRAGNRKMAKLCLEKALTRFPENSLSYSTLADIAIQQGEEEKALGHLIKAVEFDSFCSSTLAKLGIMLFWLNRPEDGARALHRALYCARYEQEPERITDSIMSSADELLQKPGISEDTRRLKDIIYLPLGVRNTELFKQYVDEKALCAVYKIDFKGDREAYLSTSLGDLLEADSVMLYDQRPETFREASRGRDGEYYYASGGGRVAIDSGTIFYVPLEEVPFEL